MMYGFIKFHYPSWERSPKILEGSGVGGGWREGIKGLDSKHRKSILSGVLCKISTLVKYVNFRQYEAK